MNIRLAAFAALLLSTTAALADGPKITVHKDPNCGCCTAWAELAQDAGYQVSIVDSTDIGGVKDRLGVPGPLSSCHTVEVEGYAVEGHVPFDALARLLKDRPAITGIAVPGMPEGSPGMGDDPAARYDVIAWGQDAGGGALYQRMGTD